MNRILVAALAAGSFLSSSAALAVPTYTDLGAWQAAVGSYNRDVTYGPELNDISALVLDDGTSLSFSSLLSIRTVGSTWNTWSGGYVDQVLYSNGALSLTIGFNTPLTGFGLFAQPNPFSAHQFDVSLSDGSMFGASYDGNGGAGFLGFVGTGVTWMTITSDVDFAVGDIYTAVPEPASWALMIGGFALAGAALRRRAATISFA